MNGRVLHRGSLVGDPQFVHSGDFLLRDREKKNSCYLRIGPEFYRITYLILAHTHLVRSHLIGKGGGPPLLGIALTVLSLLEQAEENQHDLEVCP